MEKEPPKKPKPKSEGKTDTPDITEEDTPDAPRYDQYVPPTDEHLDNLFRRALYDASDGDLAKAGELLGKLEEALTPDTPPEDGEEGA